MLKPFVRLLCVFGLCLFTVQVSFAESSVIPLDLTQDGELLLITDSLRYNLTIFNTQTEETIEITNSRGAGYYASFSPDEKYVCYKYIKQNENGQIESSPALFSLKTSKTTFLGKPSKITGTPAVSPDGKIAYTIEDELIVLNPDMSEYLRKNLGFHVNLMAFSSDGFSLFYPDMNQQIVEFDLKSMEKKKISNDQSASFWGPVVSPNGEYISYQSAAGNLFAYEKASKKTYSVGKGENASWVDENSLGYIRRYSDGRKVTEKEIYLWNPSKSISMPKVCYGGDTEIILKGSSTVIINPKFNTILKTDLNIINDGLYMSDWEKRKEIPIVSEEKITIVQKEYSSQKKAADIILDGVPTIHQVYDTPNWFNGHWACGATSACMALTYYDLLSNWDCTVSSPYSHVSHFGRYICETYTYNGHTFDIEGDDASGTPATGGYGYIIQNDWEETRGHMAEYISYHGPESSVDWSASITKARKEINNHCPFVVLNMLTTSGHYITCVGYDPDQYTFIFNDPYGNKNTTGYPSYDGTAVYYDWPGYNYGNQNLNGVSCFIYARMDTGKFSNAIQNGGFEDDFTSWSEGGSTSHEILTSGAHGGSKACRFYRSDGYSTIWQNPDEQTGELWKTTCYAYAYPDTTSPEFGFKDQVGETEASDPITESSWQFCSVEWTIADDIDVQAWGSSSSNGVVIDDVRCGKASRMNWITDWCCCAQFPANLTTDHFSAYGGEASIQPNPGSTYGSYEWASFTTYDGFIDLNEFIGSSHSACVAYANVYVNSESAQSDVCLMVGADDGIQVLLNGVVVHTNNSENGHDYFNPDEEKIEGVSLLEGENQLMIKVRDAGEDYSFSARFCDDQGDALEGLTYSLTSEGTPVQYWMCY